MLINTEPVQIEQSGKDWRVVTRSPHSGRCLKVWAKGDRAEMELLARGINKEKTVEVERLVSNSIRITSRTKCLGWAYSTVFSGGRVEVPQTPMFTGTINQLCKRIKKDPQYRADQNLRKAERWFYRGAMILGIGTYANLDQRQIDLIIRLLDKEGTTVYLDRKIKRGRPKTLGETTPVTVRLEPDCLKILESLEGNPSEVIRRLLREKGAVKSSTKYLQNG